MKRIISIILLSLGLVTVLNNCSTKDSSPTPATPVKEIRVGNARLSAEADGEITLSNASSGVVYVRVLPASTGISSIKVLDKGPSVGRISVTPGESLAAFAANACLNNLSQKLLSAFSDSESDISEGELSALLQEIIAFLNCLLSDQALLSQLQLTSGEVDAALRALKGGNNGGGNGNPTPSGPSGSFTADGKTYSSKTGTECSSDSYFIYNSFSNYISISKDGSTSYATINSISYSSSNVVVSGSGTKTFFGTFTDSSDNSITITGSITCN